MDVYVVAVRFFWHFSMGSRGVGLNWTYSTASRIPPGPGQADFRFKRAGAIKTTLAIHPGRADIRFKRAVARWFKATRL